MYIPSGKFRVEDNVKNSVYCYLLLKDINNPNNFFFFWYHEGLVTKADSTKFETTIKKQ